MLKLIQLRTWFKGADTAAICKFVEHTFGQLTAPAGFELYCECIHLAAEASNTVLSCMYTSGLWLRPMEASAIARHSLCFARRFRECSELAFQMEKCRFRITPKYHAYVHLTHAVIQQLGNLVDEVLENDTPAILNPLSYSCQLDEDYIGSIAMLSRTTTTGHVHEGTMNRYLVTLQREW